ncbi:hypothetical protein PILCRDRAFT_116490 [Piloderma croceum F 1598]|uniref:Uncharacterized protein n=1 Tax=Piloderma croceum (strain F 1598) TaxID=765440 RepID=A0A0C3GNW7_PILCF|nr:hypothetical protein PILCRDRAFT_116490 [Piloderma croceum F 1598]
MQRDKLSSVRKQISRFGGHASFPQMGCYSHAVLATTEINTFRRYMESMKNYVFRRLIRPMEINPMVLQM